jgi:serine-type D-Ala-D-Ala carboxypeptidase/endopeptidase
LRAVWNAAGRAASTLEEMRLFIASLLLLSLSPAFAQTMKPALLPDLKEAGALGEELYQNTGATGLVLVAVRGNQVFIRGYGETGPGSGVRPDASSVVRLCSLTKIFTTDVLSKLVKDGTVHLDDTLQQYAPTGAVVPQKMTAITLLDLATHTSGLSREVGTAPRGTPHFTYPDYATRWRWLPRQKLLFEPGSSALYSNVGYDLLSDALSAATHKPFSVLLSEETLKPLGLRETTYTLTESQCARLMTNKRAGSLCAPTLNTEGSSGLYSTAADVAIWLKYLLGTGSPAIPAQADAAHAIYLLPSDLRLQSGLAHAGKPAGIGLGWMHLGANDDPQHLIEKTGGGAGFTTYITIHPASHTALFVAMTEGPPRRGAKYFNIFKGANNAVLALAGLPALDDDPRKPSAHVRAKANARASAARHARHGNAKTGKATTKSSKATAKTGKAAKNKAHGATGKKQTKAKTAQKPAHKPTVKAAKKRHK